VLFDLEEKHTGCLIRLDREMYVCVCVCVYKVDDIAAIENDSTRLLTGQELYSSCC
jgi:hypothetical protein